MFFKYSKIKTLNLSILVESIHYKIYVNDLISIQFSEKIKQFQMSSLLKYFTLIISICNCKKCEMKNSENKKDFLRD